MPDDTGTLERLGEQISQALGDGPPESRIEAQRRDLISIVSAEHRNKGMKYMAMALAASFVMAMFGVVALLWRETPNLHFWVGEQLSAGSEGAWVEPSEDSVLPIRFEGGSTFDLEENTSARVVTSSVKKVEIDLKKGKIMARVKGNGQTKWIMNAGPYQIHVMGTEFTALWNEALSLLEISVQRGLVVVHGSGMDERGTGVSAGYHLKIDRGDVLVYAEPSKPAPIDAASRSAENDDSSGGDSVQPVEQAEAEPEKISARGRLRDNPRQKESLNGKEPSEKTEAPTWKDFYKSGDFDQAVAAAQSQGIDNLMVTLGHEDLWQLANAARYTGKGKISTDILLAIRNRFSGYRRAEAATFLLGRVALEIDNNPSGAKRWFETYLTESPGGSLSEEALGRLIDACERAGDHERAREKATLYLTRYPQGLFKDLARSVLNN